MRVALFYLLFLVFLASVTAVSILGLFWVR